MHQQYVVNKESKKLLQVKLYTRRFASFHLTEKTVRLKSKQQVMLYFGHNKNQMGLTIRDAKIKGIDILLKYLKNRKLVDQRNKKSKANIYDSTVYNCPASAVLLHSNYF